MQEKIQQLFEKVDALELRQRILVLFGFLTLIFVVADTFAIQPALKQQKTFNQEITDWQNKLDVLDLRSGLLPGQPGNSTATEYMKMLELMKKLDTRVHEQLGDLLAPEQAIEVLEQILEQEQGLRLLEVNTSSSPLSGVDLLGEATGVIPAEDGEETNTGIGRYRIQLQLEGSYLATLRYLRALENLPWKFFWEGLDFEVTDHPNARTTLDIYTLGLLGDPIQ